MKAPSRAVKPTTVRIPPDLLQRAERIAKVQHRSRSSVMNQILADGLTREERKKPPTEASVGALD